MEVSAPGLHHRELAEVGERGVQRAEAARREADERARVARPDRPVARIDDAWQLACDRGLPPVTGTVVDVLRIGLVPPGALRRDENRRTLRRIEGLLDEADASISGAARRQAVQEVHDGIAQAARAVAH